MNTFKYLGCDISRYKMNVELEGRVQKLDGCIKNLFWGGGGGTTGRM
jgi:hypothetical protein